MAADHTDYVVVFRTGQLFQVDWVSNSLKEAGIPYFTREETVSGLRLAMPAAPATGPGVWWSVLVPVQLADKAKEVLSALPFKIGTESDIWDFKPTNRVKIGWKVYATGILCLTVIPLIVRIIREMMQSR